MSSLQKDKLSTLNMRILTWNLNKVDFQPGILSPAEFHMSPEEVEKLDIIVIGFQEGNFLSLKYLYNMFCIGNPWGNQFKDFLSSYGFVQLTCNHPSGVFMMGLSSVIFLKRHLLSLVKTVQVKYIRSGFYGLSGHKGTLCIHLNFTNGAHTVLLNSHCTPHAHKLARREIECEQVMRKCNFKPNCTLTSEDFVFWFGDLNFRVDGLTKDEVKRYLDNGNYSELLKHDQLNECKSENAALKEFNEAQIEFAPTYKFKPGEKNERNFRINKTKRFLILFSRIPSYCDRILWRTADHCCESSCHVPNCKIKKYTSVEHVFCSDHKAVLADFKIQCPLSVSSPEMYFCNSDGSEFNNCWYVNENSICTFFEPNNFKAGFSDWIGLYEVGFSSDLDVVTWKYVFSKWMNRKSEKGIYQNVLFLGKFLVKTGKYQLGYYSQSSRCLRALSNPFQIVHRDEKKKD
ncbi:Inositol polyphosphate 5-phosphatase K [Trichinella papuae]|uniref:Inositol polyphosphate 5-phosphatase K n=1 Tax=Trichinella papuae TaxID=268474 RepID=A0A0V1N334_9BILA|nr:Inositol polyphosphate 5-phosphatase K [Trichinella papuae]